MNYKAISLSLLACLTCMPWIGAQEAKYQGSIKIVNLLWEANGPSAATTLRKTLDSALSRGQVAEVGVALQPLHPKLVAVTDEKDPRYAVSLVGLLLLPSDSEPVEIQQLNKLVKRWVMNRASAEVDGDSELMDLMLRSWYSTQPESAQDSLREFLELESSPMKETLLQACLRASFQVDPAGSFALVEKSWGRVPAAARVQVIEPMTSSADLMLKLLKSIKAGSIDKSLVNTNQLRKWMQAEEDVTEVQQQIRTEIESVWGKIRAADNEERQRLVQSTIKLLNSGVSGSVTRGKVVFGKACSQCHRLHDVGYEVGPNIAGNGRGSLQQLVSNILDPSLVIGEAFQSTTVLTVDAKVVSGILAGETEQYLKLKTQGGKVVEFDKEDIELVKASDKSLMPEGVEVQMTEQELIDLFAYLCLLKPLGAADNELIPGTPPDLVQE